MSNHRITECDIEGNNRKESQEKRLGWQDILGITCRLSDQDTHFVKWPTHLE